MSFALSTTQVPTAEAYVQSRHRDYSSLTHEIAEARKGSVADLGYCKLIQNHQVQIKDTTHSFDSFTAACAFILRRFW